MGVLTDRYGGRLIFAGAARVLRASGGALRLRRLRTAALIGVGFLLGVAGSSFAVGVPFVAGLVHEGAAGLRARRLRDGEHRDGDRVLRRAGDRRPLGPAGARLGDRRRAPRRRVALLLVRRATRRATAAADALPRGPPVGLAALPARLLLLHHLRRVRRDGVPAARRCCRTGSTTRRARRAHARPASSSPRRSRGPSAAGSRTASARTRCSCSSSPASRSTPPCSRRSRRRRGSSR